jgi:hypothetical protein
VKEVFKHLLFFGHGRFLDMLFVQRGNAALRREVPIAVGLASERLSVWIIPERLYSFRKPSLIAGRFSRIV